MFSLKFGNSSYSFDPNEPKKVGITLNFNTPHAQLFGVESAKAETFRAGDFVADTRLGASCNAEVLTIVPHCNGTHTECCGHISKHRHFLSEGIKLNLMPATLTSIKPESAAQTTESSIPAPQPSAQLITEKTLAAALEHADSNFLVALVIRTLPNGVDKLSRNYDQVEAPYFSAQAMRYLRNLGVQHLLVDLPSVDRTSDPDLTAHRIFWDFDQKGFTPRSAEAEGRTITELIYVPDEVQDGVYVLNLLVPAIRSDAAPSSPVLYDLTQDDDANTI